MRIAHWLYAKLKGYWWEKCAECGYAFGGHEAAEYVTVNEWGFCRGICCPKCRAEM